MESSFIKEEFNPLLSHWQTFEYFQQHITDWLKLVAPAVTTNGVIHLGKRPVTLLPNASLIQGLQGHETKTEGTRKKWRHRGHWRLRRRGGGNKGMEGWEAWRMWRGVSGPVERHVWLVKGGGGMEVEWMESGKGIKGTKGDRVLQNGRMDYAEWKWAMRFKEWRRWKRIWRGGRHERR